MKELLIYINKQIGESGQLRDEATLDHIVNNSKNMAKDIAQMHPFIDGNKRTAYIVHKLVSSPYCLILKNMLELYTKRIIDDILKKREVKEWLDILKEC